MLYLTSCSQFTQMAKGLIPKEIKHTTGPGAGIKTSVPRRGREGVDYTNTKTSRSKKAHMT